MLKNKEGLLVVISGPSGVGKGTICKEYFNQKKDAFLSVSATTRQPRQGEIDGESYHFFSHEKFNQLIKEDYFLEWADFCGQRYGTPKKPVFDCIAQGKDVVLEIEVQGAMQIRAKHPEGVYIFILPPSMEELRKRLEGRGTESKDVVEKRLQTALKELEYASKYNYYVINDTVENAVGLINKIIEVEKLRSERCNLNI
ncbi:MAG: guanylate kinase [Clostridia bacterium]|nr:guanylate kinase [Clostridia bacterium]